MPPPTRSPCELGYIVDRDGAFHTQFMVRDLGAQLEGPRRGSDKERASKELVAIRAAHGEGGGCRSYELT